MRSVETALTVDYLRRGAIAFPVALLTMIGLPIWLLSVLDARRTLEPTSPESVVLHVTLTLSLGFGAAVAVFHAHGRLARFFMRPISSARLVTCQMGLGMATIALMYVITATIVNVLGVQWPVIGPALYLATSLACALAAIWSLEGNVLGQLVGCSASTIPLLIWFNRRYGATYIGDWDQMWLNPTAGEALTLCAVAAAAYGVAIRSVANVRRGEIWDFAAFFEWLENIFRSGAATAKFGSSWRAQVWCEAREKMVLVPACLLGAALLVAGAAWLSGELPSQDFMSFALVMPVVAMTTVMPLVYGILVGNCGQEKRPGMRHVLATRPVTDQFLAAALLRTAAAALVWAWSAWLVGIVVVTGLVYLADGQEMIGRVLSSRSSAIGSALIMVIGVPFLSWTITTLLGSLIATGRTPLVVAVIGLVITGWFSFGLLKGYAPQHISDLVVHIWLMASGTLALAGTLWAFVAAARQRLISTSVIIPAVAVWGLLGGVAIYLWQLERGHFVWLWHVLGVLALGIFPLAAMPLAVRWNRHR